jgi:hypothetical protein
MATSRSTEVRHENDGTCHAYHRESLTLDLRKATKGIRPQWEALYEFVNFYADGEVDVGTVTCPPG